MLLSVNWVESQRFPLLQWMKMGSFCLKQQQQQQNFSLDYFWWYKYLGLLIMQIFMHSLQKWVDMVMQTDNLATTVSSGFS